MVTDSIHPFFVMYTDNIFYHLFLRFSRKNSCIFSLLCAGGAEGLPGQELFFSLIMHFVLHEEEKRDTLKFNQIIVGLLSNDHIMEEEAAAMRKTRHPIQRTLILGIIAFVLALCILLSLLSYKLFSAALYNRYQYQLENILTYVEHNIDADDLKSCLLTGEPSETYKREQQFLNGMVDDMGLAYLYIVIPERELMYNAISATSAEEFAAGATDMAILEPTDAYTPESLARYRSFWDTQGVSFFEEDSDWGFFYTGILPLRDSQGETVALACADVPIADLHARINTYLILNTLLILGISALFGVAMLLWMRRSVTKPILALEKSARGFAEKSHTIKDFREMKYEGPEIKAQNEVRSLGDTVDKMANDIFRYVEDVLTAEQRARNAEMAARSMTEVAYQDALTHVKNKAAYDQMVQILNSAISRGDAKFALVMVDLNDLKRMNDTHGHRNGDRYIIGSCEQICQVYTHSLVYRIGGDEFVAILRGQDYEDREVLFEQLQQAFIASRQDETRPPWERYSAAGGMAEYTGAEGETAEDVFRRADKRMYANKQKMKA